MIPRLWLRWIQGSFLLLAGVLLALWSGAFLASFDFQARASAKLDAALRAAEYSSDGASINAEFVGPLESSPEANGTEPDDVLGRIEIPRLGITAIVAEGTDAATLKRAVGHVSSTALPGSPGNCALAGHRDSFFRGLGKVRENDLIRVVTLEGTHTYQVEWTVVVDPSSVEVLDATDARSLTLVTCYPFVFVGHAPRRFVVRALQVEAIAGNPDSQMQPGSGDAPR